MPAPRANPEKTWSPARPDRRETVKELEITSVAFERGWRLPDSRIRLGQRACGGPWGRTGWNYLTVMAAIAVLALAASASESGALLAAAAAACWPSALTT